MAALSANEIFKKTFNGRSLVNTKIVTRGKLNKHLAYEIAQNNAPYSDHETCFVTICSDKGRVEDFDLETSYPDQESAFKAVAELKNAVYLAINYWIVQIGFEIGNNTRNNY